MQEPWNSEYFMERVKRGEFDDDLFEALGQLSTEELQEIADVLLEEGRLKARIN